VAQSVVELDGVGKRYLLGQGRGARGVLFDVLGLHRPAREQLWALRDVSLRVQPGESVGLIGANGAGKTTVLKLLAGVSRPTRGHVRTRGRVAALLNVGAGFHPELTGRQNVLLNGVILGLSRREVARRYDQIVAFAGLEAFMDTPVKRYSSGMYARLAFSVAAHVDPDVLLVDEVLSVGDASFQDASLRRMLAFRDSGAAVVFVSHNMAAVELMCQRAVWLDHGRVRASGPTHEVVRAYLDAVDAEPESSETATGALSINALEVLDARGQPTAALPGNAPFTVRVAGQALRELAEPVFVVTIRSDYGPLFAGNMHIDGSWPGRVPAGPFRLECGFGPPRLAPGRYRVELKVKQNVRTNYYEPRVLAQFDVPGPTGAGGRDVSHAWHLLCPAADADAMIGAR
jgi:ABC-2 type transport system ATP-binding protein/lipopolysaccharide transport system ATP-binding protein